MVAVSRLRPGSAPSVHEVAAATPSAPVGTGVVGATVPSPSVTSNTTSTSLTGFPPASVTLTAGGVATGVPAAALCPSPAVFSSLAGAAVSPEAWNATLRLGGAWAPVTSAVACWIPAVGPSVHCVPAVPSAAVVALAGDKDPPPPALNATGWFATG